MLLLLVYLSNLLFPVPYVPGVSLFTAAAAAVASYRKRKKKEEVENFLSVLSLLYE
jgi:precorrin-4 methylase